MTHLLHGAPTWPHDHPYAPSSTHLPPGLPTCSLEHPTAIRISHLLPWLPTRSPEHPPAQLRITHLPPRSCNCPHDYPPALMITHLPSWSPICPMITHLPLVADAVMAGMISRYGGLAWIFETFHQAGAARPSDCGEIISFIIIRILI